MLPSDWEPADGLELEPSALDVVVSVNNRYVIAGPGAGKTELLAQRADYLLRTNLCKNPKRILAISFKRDAAKNIYDRVKRRCGLELSYRFVSLTYDAFAKIILDHFLYSLPETYRPSLDYEVAWSSDIVKVYKMLACEPTKDSEKVEMVRAPTKYKLPLPDTSNNKIEEQTPDIWQICLKGKDTFLPKLTFQMIARLSEYLIRHNPKIHKALVTTYSHVFLDEFQDTTTLQYELIKTCFLNTNTLLTAVGDDKQRIMIWAGADRNIFDKIKKDFNAQKTPLLMNFRSAPRLIEIQKILCKYLTNETIETIANKKWKKEDGICEIWNFKNPKDESITLAENIKKWINDEGLTPKDICVIVKQKSSKYGKELIDALNDFKIMARDESLLQDMLAEDCVQIVLDLILLSFSKTAGEEWLRTFELLKFLRCINPHEDSDGKQLRLLENNLRSYLSDLKNTFSKITSISDFEIELWNIIKYLGKNEFKILFPQYRRGGYLNKLMKDLTNSLWREFSVHKKWDEAVDSLKGKNSISIMTIHKSKGLEYDTVIFLGLEDSAFWSFKNQSEEDTCAFFVALSRAKRRVIFTFSNIRNTGYEDRLERQTKSKIKSLYDIIEQSGVATEKTFE